MLAFLMLVVSVLGLSTANLSRSSIFWAAALVVAVTGFILLISRTVQNRRRMGVARALTVLLACEVLIGSGILAGINAVDGFRCEEANAALSRGQDFEATDQDGRAYEEYGKALGSCVPGSALLYRGYIDERSGRSSAARDNYQQALNILPADASRGRSSTYLHLGIVNNTLGNCDEAVKNLRDGSAIDPDNVAFYHTLTLVRVKQGVLRSTVYPDALESEQLALDRSPTRAIFLRLRASILWTVGDFAGADRDLSRIITLGARSDEDRDALRTATERIGAVRAKLPAPIDFFPPGSCH